MYKPFTGYRLENWSQKYFPIMPLLGWV